MINFFNCFGSAVLYNDPVLPPDRINRISISHNGFKYERKQRTNFCTNGILLPIDIANEHIIGYTMKSIGSNTNKPYGFVWCDDIRFLHFWIGWIINL